MIDRMNLAALLLPAALCANPVLRDLPANTWYRVPNSKLSPLCPSESQFPTVRGMSGCRMVMGAWSGGTYDAAGKRLWIWGGGHGDYYGNELYAFHLETLRWERVTDPSPVGALSVDPMPDGSPVARHTYDGLAWISHAGRFFGYGGSMAGNGYGTEVTWTFDPATEKWRNMAPAGNGNRPSTNCCNFSSEYDPGTRKVFMREPSWLCAYDYDKNEWTRVKSWSHSWGPGKGVVDTKRRLYFTLGSGEFLVYDIDGNKDVSVSWKTTGGDAVLNANGVGAAYDSHSDRLVAWVGGGVYVLNLETKAWTRMSAEGAPAAPLGNGTFGRFRYVPGDNVFVLANGIDEDVFFYKLTAGGSSGTVSALAEPARLRPARSGPWHDLLGIRVVAPGSAGAAGSAPRSPRLLVPGDAPAARP